MHQCIMHKMQNTQTDTQQQPITHCRHALEPRLGHAASKPPASLAPICGSPFDEHVLQRGPAVGPVPLLSCPVQAGGYAWEIDREERGGERNGRAGWLQQDTSWVAGKQTWQLKRHNVKHVEVTAVVHIIQPLGTGMCCHQAHPCSALRLASVRENAANTVGSTNGDNEAHHKKYCMPEPSLVTYQTSVPMPNHNQHPLLDIAPFC